MHSRSIDNAQKESMILVEEFAAGSLLDGLSTVGIAGPGRVSRAE